MKKSSMLKLLMSASILASNLFASNIDEKIANFFLSVIDNNNGMFRIKKIQVKGYKELKDLPGWKVYFVDIDLDMLKDKKDMVVHEKVFTNGKYIVKDFLDINTHRSLKRDIGVDISDNSIYNKKHLVYGTGNEPHKIVTFSDPLCPFCQHYMPQLLKAVKEHPGKIALYYYHLPLGNLHLASPTLARLMIVAKKKGVKDVELKTYKGKDHFVTNETDETKTIRAFNQVMGTNITKEEIHQPWVDKELEEDKKVADELMISGTPTVYVDGKKDSNRDKYKKILGL